LLIYGIKKLKLALFVRSRNKPGQVWILLMIKKIQPVVEKKNSTWGCKLQAPSLKQQATLDNGYGI